MSKDKNLKKTKGDYALSIAKAGLGSIPVIGAAASELLGIIVTPPLEKRRQKWMEEVGKRLKSLEDKGYELEELKENEIFLDTVLSATQIALRNSNKEKLEYLKNAIINTAITETTDESLIHIFLSLIDTFTIWHIRILCLFSDPIKWFEKNEKQLPNLTMGGLSTILEYAYNELRGKRDFYDLIWSDLYKNALINTEGIHTTMSSSGLYIDRTSDLGNKFLNFITGKE